MNLVIRVSIPYEWWYSFTTSFLFLVYSINLLRKGRSFEWIHCEKFKIRSGYNLHRSRDQSRYVPSPWETSLQCNDVSHWLGAYLDWSLQVCCDISKIVTCMGIYNDNQRQKFCIRFNYEFINHLWNGANMDQCSSSWDWIFTTAMKWVFSYQWAVFIQSVITGNRTWHWCMLGIAASGQSTYILGLYSLSVKTSYRQITWSLEAARLDVIMNV